MKGLSIKEKAQRYDKALKVAKDIRNGKATYIPNGTPVIETLFPELAESEDEMTRKELIEYIRKTTHVNFIGKCSEKEAEKFIAWLEKQKSTEWNNEDKKIFNQIVSIIEDTDLVRAENISIYTNWLKSRVQPQLNWRPTELQIEALESATANCAYSEYQDCLKELIKQLKQL